MFVQTWTKDFSKDKQVTSKFSFQFEFCIAISWQQRINPQFPVIVGTQQLSARKWRNLLSGYWTSSKRGILLLERGDGCQQFLLCLDQMSLSPNGSLNFTSSVLQPSCSNVSAKMLELIHPLNSCRCTQKDPIGLQTLKNPKRHRQGF